MGETSILFTSPLYCAVSVVRHRVSDKCFHLVSLRAKVLRLCHRIVRWLCLLVADVVHCNVEHAISDGSLSSNHLAMSHLLTVWCFTYYAHLESFWYGILVAHYHNKRNSYNSWWACVCVCDGRQYGFSYNCICGLAYAFIRKKSRIPQLTFSYCNNYKYQAELKDRIKELFC